MASSRRSSTDEMPHLRLNYSRTVERITARCTPVGYVSCGWSDERYTANVLKLTDRFIAHLARFRNKELERYDSPASTINNDANQILELLPLR